MASNIFFRLLSGTFTATLTLLLMLGEANAQCATSGAITTGCTLSSDLTGEMTIGDSSNTVTVTIDSDITIGHTINDDDSSADGYLETDGGGRTIDQTADIGATKNLKSLTLGAGDTWNTSATLAISTIDLNSGTININDGGNILSDIDDTGGIGTLNYGADGNGGTFKVNGDIDTVAITITSGSLSTNGNNIGSGTSLDNIAVNSGATFYVNDNVTSIGTLTNSGTIRLKAGETLSVSDMTASTGTFVFQVESNSVFGELEISGANDVDLSGATAEIEVSIGDINDGDELLIAYGNATVNSGAGQALETVEDNSYLWSFQIADGSQAEINTAGATDNEIYLIVTQDHTLEDASTTTNNANIGNALDGMSDTTIGLIQEILTNMNSASTREELNNVLEASQVTVDGSQAIGILNVSDLTLDITGRRLSALRNGTSGVSSGSVAEGWRMWAQGFAEMAKQSGREGIDGYDADTHGYSLGIDTETYIDDTVLGIAFTYGSTEVNSDNANSTYTEINSYQFTIYGSHDIDNQTFFNGIIGYSWSNVDTFRHDVGGIEGLTAQGDADATHYVTQIEIGRNYDLDKTRLTPSILAHYLYYQPNDYDEAGAQGANLSVNNYSYSMFEMGIGLDANRLYKLSNGDHFEPEIRTEYRYDFIGDPIEATSRFTEVESYFRTEGFSPARSTLNIGGSLKYYSSDNWEAMLDYGLELKEDYYSHTALVKAAYRF